MLRVASPGGVFAFFVRVLSDMQNMLSSWATAILLQQEVLVLRSEFQCALAAESSLSGFDKIFRATRSRAAQVLTAKAVAEFRLLKTQGQINGAARLIRG